MPSYISVTVCLLESVGIHVCVCDCVCPPPLPQDVGMNDKAMTTFLGSCVQLLQILIEVTGLLAHSQNPFSFLCDDVSGSGDARMRREGAWCWTGRTDACTFTSRVFSRHYYPE